MPAPAAFPPGAPMWVDVVSSDPAASTRFYTELFGWTAHDGGEEYGNYQMLRKDGAAVAGIAPNRQPGAVPDSWTTYLHVPDADAAGTAVTAAGGQLFMPPLQVGEMGTMFVGADPTGAVVGGWQPGGHTGFELVAEPDAPAWHELHTTGYDSAVEFYRAAFGWQTKVMEMPDAPEGFRYTQLSPDDGHEPWAGIMDQGAFAPAGTPSSWHVYFSVADTDATVEHAVSLGATVVDAPVDTPFGRMARLTDPGGASFTVIA